MIREEELGIEELELCWQAVEEDLELPVGKWGSRARRDVFGGLWHFYTWDYKFTGLLRDGGETLVRTGCRAAVEVNFSTWDEMPGWEAIQSIGRKRRLSAAWGRAGVRLLVDLNVARVHRKVGLLGVPRGWRAYATRAHRSGGPESILEDHAWAVEHAGTEELVFLVYGGGKAIGELCRERGWRHGVEHMQVVSPTG